LYRAVTARRFPPPLTVIELDACFVVRDANATAVSTKVIHSIKSVELKLTFLARS
jgi:hypothetical protein